MAGSGKIMQKYFEIEIRTHSFQFLALCFIALFSALPLPVRVQLPGAA
jgi:hypothetical protein